ncbi:MAG: Uma2 family endonuclease [Pyrinomonadaceae bacterium]|nr:Uma2 family endonuclease [Pyrinomonadaceae bacterium]
MNQTAPEPTNNRSSKTLPANDRPFVGKTEYLDGRIATKPAANRWHSLIAANFAIAIGSRINRGTCEMYTSDMQVMIGRSSVCYPDVVVVTGEPVFADGTMEALQNPAVVIEIFAGAANTAGRTQKLEGFLAVESIKECLLVNESEMRIEHYARQNAKQWIYRIYNERDDVISLESIHCKLSLAEVYAQVKLRESELSSKAVN